MRLDAPWDIPRRDLCTDIGLLVMRNGDHRAGGKAKTGRLAEKRIAMAGSSLLGLPTFQAWVWL